MDPLSITASVLTLLGATEAAGHGLRRLWSLREAPAYLAALQNEITDFRALLSFVKSALDSIPDQGSIGEDDLGYIRSAVQRGAEVIQEINALIDTRLTRQNVEDGSQYVRRRGFMKQQRIQKLCLTLREARTNLSTALSAISYLHLRQELPRFHLSIQSISFISPTESSSPDITDAPNGSTLILSRPLEQAGPVLENIPIEGAAGVPTKSSVVIDTTPANVRCRDFCACQCHIRSIGEGIHPRWLQVVFGTLFYSYNGTPLLRRRSCNLKSCIRNSGTARFEYWFPSWLLGRIFSFSATWNDLQGIGGTWSLRVPEYLPSFGAGIIELMRRGESLQRFEKYLDTHRISARALQPGNGVSLLDWAVSSKRVDICEILLKRGADWTDRNPQHPSKTPAETAWAYILGEPNSRTALAPLRPLLEEADTLWVFDFNVLHRVVTGLDDGNVEEIVNSFPDLLEGADSLGDTPLFWAVRRCDEEMVSTLLRLGANPCATNKKKQTPLHILQTPDALVCARALVDAGADVNAISVDKVATSTPLAQAALMKDSNLVRLLLERGANPNLLGGLPPLIIAAERGHLEQLEIMLDSGADVNIRSYAGGSAISYATQFNHANSVKLLRDRGARMDYLDHDGDSILDLAACFGSISIMKILTEAKIRGLDTRDEAIAKYWDRFNTIRDALYVGERALPEEERAAFEALLHSAAPRNIAAGSPLLESLIPEDGDENSISEIEEFVDAMEDFELPSRPLDP